MEHQRQQQLAGLAAPADLKSATLEERADFYARFGFMDQQIKLRIFRTMVAGALVEQRQAVVGAEEENSPGRKNSPSEVQTVTD